MPNTIQKEIHVHELRKGDRFADTGDVVTFIQRKKAWATVIVESGREQRMRLDGSIVVLRDEPTDEERAAIQRDYMVDGLRKHLIGLLRNTPIERVNDAIAKYNPVYGELLTSWNLPDMLKTQALYRQGLVIRHCVLNLAERRSMDVALRLDHPDDVKLIDDDVLIDAYATWHYKTSVHRFPQDPTSRSTSPLNNLLEDLERWAVERIADDLRWYVRHGEFEVRIAAALAKKETESVDTLIKPDEL